MVYLRKKLEPEPIFVVGEKNTRASKKKVDPKWIGYKTLLIEVEISFSSSYLVLLSRSEQVLFGLNQLLLK